MRKAAIVFVLVSILGPVAFLRAQGPQSAQAKRPLDIYFIDTEGGQATLFVSPSGESMLVDTGFAGNGGMPAAAGGNSGAGGRSSATQTGLAPFSSRPE